MPTTPRLYPYPLATDTPDVPRDLYALAAYLDRWVPLLVGGQVNVACNVSGAFTADLTTLIPAFPYNMPAPPTAVIATPASTADTCRFIVTGPIASWTTHSVTGNCYTVTGAACANITVRINLLVIYGPTV